MPNINNSREPEVKNEESVKNENYFRIVDTLLSLSESVATIYEAQNLVFIEQLAKCQSDIDRKFGKARDEMHQSLRLMEDVLREANDWMKSQVNQLPEICLNEKIPKTELVYGYSTELGGNIPKIDVEAVKTENSEDRELAFLEITIKSTTALAQVLWFLWKKLQEEEVAIQWLVENNSNQSFKADMAIRNIVASIKIVVEEEYTLLTYLNEKHGGGVGRQETGTSSTLPSMATERSSNSTRLAMQLAGDQSSSSTLPPAASSNCPSSTAPSSSASSAAAPIRRSLRVPRSTRRLSPDPSQKAYEK